MNAKRATERATQGATHRTTRPASTRAEIRKLTNEDLLLGASELTLKERGVVLGLLFYLEEIESRRDYGAFSCLWDFCVMGLGMPSGQAFLRVTASRLIRKYPQAIERLRDGRLNLSTLVALRKALTTATADVLFQQVEGKTKKEAVLVAAMTKARVVPKSSIRPVKPRFVKVPPKVAELRFGEQGATGSEGEDGSAQNDGRAGSDGSADSPTPEPLPEPLPETYLVTGVEDVRDLQCVSATQCKVTVTAPIQFQRDLEELAPLVSHRVPDGDLAGILQYAVSKLLADLRKKRGVVPVAETSAKPADLANLETVGVAATHAAPSTSTTPSPSPTPGPASSPSVASPSKRPAPVPDGPPPVIQQMENFKGRGFRRVHIPEAMRKRVWERDGGCCQMTKKHGRICGSKWQCELDHVTPVARGGLTVEENLRVLCRDCNQAAERTLFGDEFVDRRIAESKNRRPVKKPARAATTADPPTRK